METLVLLVGLYIVVLPDHTEEIRSVGFMELTKAECRVIADDFNEYAKEKKFRKVLICHNGLEA